MKPKRMDICNLVSIREDQSEVRSAILLLRSEFDPYQVPRRCSISILIRCSRKFARDLSDNV